MLHAVESSTICFLQIIQQLQDELAALRREQEGRKAAEAAEEKRAVVAANRREYVWPFGKRHAWYVNSYLSSQKKTKNDGCPTRQDGGREGEGPVEVKGEVEGGGEGEVYCMYSTIMITSSKNQRWLGVVTHSRLISSTPIYGPLINIWLAIRLA